MTPAWPRKPETQESKTRMDSAELRAMQAPIKDRYRRTAGRGDHAEGQGHARRHISPARSRPAARSRLPGLHPATGGSGLELCSGDMLLEALVACAGVTLKAVATALEFRSSPAWSRPRATSTSAARSASPRTRRSASRRSACASMSTPTRRRKARPAAQAHRALLRGLSDHPERPAGRGKARAGVMWYRAAPMA